MLRFSLRSLLIGAFVCAVATAVITQILMYESPADRDIRLFGSTPISNPELLFENARKIAEYSSKVQNDYGDSDRHLIPKFTRVELAQIAHHYRTMYPFVSLRKRLEYETGAKGRISRLLPDAKERLVRQENPYRGRWDYLPPMRTRALDDLHSQWVFFFISQEGVGLTRMGTPNLLDLELELPQENPFECPEEDLAAGYRAEIVESEPSERELELLSLQLQNGEFPNPQRGYDQWSKEHNPMLLPTKNRMTHYHIAYVDSFADSGRNGFAKNIDEVAGFMPHRLARAGAITMDSYDHYTSVSPADTSARWVLKSLQLVSLLKYERPYVYVSDTLPNMEELPEASRRVLDEFESTGLKSLYHGNDVYLRGWLNRIRMLGSLRAHKRCLDCHHVERGELLGAFTYELVRAKSRYR